MLILRIEDIQTICTNILNAVDSSEISTITDTLEIKVENKMFYLNVTNREYYARVKLPIFDDVDLHATVNAHLFLKLISKITTDTVQFDIQDNYLILTGNGEYKLPLIYDNDKLLELPEITIENVTSNFDIAGDTLNSILQYNSRELLKGTIAKPVQKMYYIDDKGAITFTSGACVNDFKLDKPIKILLNQKLVKLFKLFKDEPVHFTLGHDEVNSVIQTKVKFETDSFSLTSIITSDDALVNSVPVEAIRDRAYATYPYSVVLNKTELLQTIDRLLLFSNNALKLYSTFEFGPDSVKVYDVDKQNFEVIKYTSTSNIEEEYTAILDLIDLKLSLESYNESHVSIHFGNQQAIVLKKTNVHTVIPEVMM